MLRTFRCDADHGLMFGIELRRPASEREVLSPLVFAVHVHRYHCVAMSFMTNQLEAVIGEKRSVDPSSMVRHIHEVDLR